MSKQGLRLEERPFMVECERSEGNEHIRVRGEMDMSVTSELDREVRRAEASDASRIVLDLTHLEFLDAAGVQLLLDLNFRSKANGGRLMMITATSPHVRRVLEVTGAAAVLPFAA